MQFLRVTFLIFLLSIICFSPLLAQNKKNTTTNSRQALENFLLPEDRFKFSMDSDSENLNTDLDSEEFRDITRKQEIKILYPNEVTIDSPDFNLRIYGEGFTSDSLVKFNDSLVSTIFSDSNNLLVNVSKDLLVNPGTILVSVFNPVNGNYSSDFLAVIQSTDSITIDDVQPGIVLENESPFILRVSGSGFDDTSALYVGGEKVNTEIKKVGENSFLVARVSNLYLKGTSNIPIQVKNNNVLSKVFNLTVAPKAPLIQSIQPDKINLNSSDTLVKINGKHFSSNAKVIINGTLVSSTFVKTTQIQATVPSTSLKNIGVLEVQVDIPENGSSQKGYIAVVDAGPTVLGLFPSRVFTGSPNTKLLIEGINLSNRNKSNVLVNGVSTSAIVTSSKEISITLKSTQLASPSSISIVVQVDGKSSNLTSLIVEPSNLVTSIAGGSSGFRDGIGSNALFTRPSRTAVGADGILYIADQLNNSIREVNPATGEVRTLAGDGVPGYVDSVDIDFSDKDKNNNSIRFNNPLGVAVDKKGVIYITDFGNDVIRRIQKINGSVVVDTYAGKNELRKNKQNGFESRIGKSGFKDGAGLDAKFSGPDGIVALASGQLYVADAFNNLIRVLTPGEGITGVSVSSLFGKRSPGFADGTGSAVRFNVPTGLAVDGDGKNLFVADFKNNRIRKIDLTSVRVETLAGNGVAGNLDGPRFGATLNGPTGVTLLNGKIFVADNKGNRIRRIESSGEISTIAGKRARFENGIGPNARFNSPRDIVVSNTNQLIVVDQGNNKIRQIQ